MDDIFLSTPSVRRATGQSVHVGFRVEISIHALREEGDWDADELHCSCVVFLSTPSARRATVSSEALPA